LRLLAHFKRGAGGGDGAAVGGDDEGAVAILRGAEEGLAGDEVDAALAARELRAQQRVGAEGDDGGVGQPGGGGFGYSGAGIPGFPARGTDWIRRSGPCSTRPTLRAL